ncbi:MAG TPA: hypothetical protein VES95_11355 [Dermatophilaceae bacterium]|nr:hypothetical protein [Dermatophilaceae bacterium]
MLAATAFRTCLVDEVSVLAAPATVGGGLAHFAPDPPIHLQLVDQGTFAVRDMTSQRLQGPELSPGEWARSILDLYVGLGRLRGCLARRG